MADIDPKALTRDQLESFLGRNPELIRRFERLFKVSGELTPAEIEVIQAQIVQLFDLVEEASIDAGIADAKGVEATDLATAMGHLADYLAKSPEAARREELSSVLSAIQGLSVQPPSSTDRLERLARHLEFGVAPLPNTDRIERLINALNINASCPRAEMPRTFSIDYIDWNQNPKAVDKTARMEWNPADDTLNLHHSDGVTQQMGQELYGRITNNTGSLIPNGSCLGINPATNSYVLFIANGTLTPITIIGVTTQDIPNGAQGRVTVWGQVRDIDTTGTPVGEVWVAGDILYVSPTNAGKFTKTKPTAPNLSMPIAQVLAVNATTGRIAVRPTIEQQLFYGQFTKTTDQVPSAINTANAITWDSTTIANGVSIGVPSSRIVATNAGLYKFSASFQLTSSSASVKSVWFWFRKNGVDVASSSLITSIDSATAIRTPSRSQFFSMAAGDYIELFWASDSTAVTLDSIPATAFAPAAPAAQLSVNQEQQ